jgi:hypothetical protein
VQKLGDDTRDEADDDSPKNAHDFLLSDHEHELRATLASGEARR